MKLHKLRLDHLRKRIETLTDFALDNTLDRETFRMKHRALLHEEAIAKQRLAAVEHQDGTATDNLRKFVERLKRPLLLYEVATLEEKRNFLKEILSNLQVSGKSVDVELTIPFRMIADRNKLSSGRHEETRTPDLYRVKAHPFNPFNNLNHRLGPPKPLQIRVRRGFNGLNNGLDLSNAMFHQQRADSPHSVTLYLLGGSFSSPCVAE